MDDELLDMLARWLVSLELLAPGLDDLMVPRQASSGENAGKAPVRKRSRPPLSTPILDLKAQTQDVLGRWVGQLCVSSLDVGSPPVGREIAPRALWIREHLPVLETMPWAEMAAEQIIAQAREVADVVDPPPSASDPPPLEVGPVRSIVSWARHFGVQVSERSVQRWAAAGEVSSVTAPDGRLLVPLADVLDRARSMPGQGEAGKAT